MTAVEAKQLAEKNTKLVEISKIKRIIREAATRGRFEVWYYENISDITRDKLKSDGYKVGKTQFDRNEMLTNISWS